MKAASRFAVLALAAVLSGWHTLDPDPDMHLSARTLPDGSVELNWHVPLAAVAGLVLQRTYEDAFENGKPLTAWPLPATAAGRFVDRQAADGVTYVYGLEWRNVPGQRVTVVRPPRALPVASHPALWIDKAAYTLTVMDGDRPLKRYPIALGSLPHHRKLAFDNASTPEGLYHVQAAQFHAKYYRAFDLDYPNELDRARFGLLKPSAPIGGEIQIHGRGITRNWTFGCIALRDTDMNELFEHPELGKGTEVRIWGGELQEADVATLAKGVDAARWRKALARKQVAWNGQPGSALWLALGRYQQAAGLPVSCVPDAATAKSLGL